MFQESNDAVHIALQQYSWLERGKHYLKRQDEQFYTFESLTSEVGTFSYVDLLGSKKHIEVKHAELKHFRPTDKTPPVLLDASLVSKLMLGHSEQWQLELEKSKVQAAVLELCLKDSCLCLDSLAFMSNHKVVTMNPLKAKALKIYPFGFVQKIKEKEEQAEKTDSSASKSLKAVVIVLKNKNKYLISGPKADIKKGSGGISVFHWVQPAEDENSACLSLSQVNHDSWLSVPVLRNQKSIAAGQVLSFWVPPPENKSEEPPQKKKKQ